MAADKDSDKNIFGRPRRSSFVAPSQDNSDFVPVLPPVGSAPIPAAADVNYFPTVETGQPGLREPAPPARLVVPTRKSMTEEEIATAFVDASAMTSAEQIAMLDAQVTLRQDDLRTAKEFVAVLKTANPLEAQPLLDELKVVFADVDPEIATLALGDAPIEAPAVDAVQEAFTVSSPAPTETVPLTPSPVSPSTPVAAPLADDENAGARYRGWSVLVTIAAVIAALVPASTAIFTTFGAPAADAVPALLGSNGLLVGLIAIAVSLPLIVLARSVPAKLGLTTSAAIVRLAGPFGGSVLAGLATITLVVGFLSVLIATSQGIAEQISSIPGVTSVLASVAPQGHVSVFVVCGLTLVGFVIAALPRRVFRAIVLTLTGFVVVGPALVLGTGLAVVANTENAANSAISIVSIALGIVPVIVVFVAGGESGIATVLRRDDVKLHGLWLYIGLTLGIGYAAWALVSRMGSDSVGSLFVGSNPALHLVAPTVEVAFVLGAIAFSVPVTFLAALVGRAVMMSVVGDDRAVAAVWFRVIVVLVPLALVALNVTAVLGDLTSSLPGIEFASIPVMALVGILAGASVMARRERAGWAQVVTAVLALLIVATGLVATSWALPALAPFYDSTVAPIAASVGLSGANLLVVPAGVLVATFLISLIVSSLGSVRSNRTA